MKKVIVRGPALSISGYGEHMRFVLRALKSRTDEFDIYLLNTPWGVSSWKSEDDEERNWIDSLIKKTIQAGPSLDADLSIQVTVPNEWKKICKKNIGITAGIETDRISDSWILPTYNVDKIIVPSEHAKRGILSAKTNIKNPMSGEKSKEIGVETPIDIVSFPFRNIEEEEIELDLGSSKFNFLTVAQVSPRKNVETTINAFISEFHDESDVGLILKINIANNSHMDRESVKKALQVLKEQWPNKKCQIHLLHGNLTDSEMRGLYKHKKVSCYVTSSHGEGFALPVFEAASSGLPIIAPQWGGYTDYTTIDSVSHIVGVDYKIGPVQKEAIWDGVIEKGANWCFTDINSLRFKMREVYNNTSRFYDNSQKLFEHILNNYSEIVQNVKLIDSIKEVII